MQSPQYAPELQPRWVTTFVSCIGMLKRGEAEHPKEVRHIKLPDVTQALRQKESISLSLANFLLRMQKTVPSRYCASTRAR